MYPLRDGLLLLFKRPFMKLELELKTLEKPSVMQRKKLELIEGSCYKPTDGTSELRAVSCRALAAVCCRSCLRVHLLSPCHVLSHQLT